MKGHMPGRLGFGRSYVEICRVMYAIGAWIITQALWAPCRVVCAVCSVAVLASTRLYVCRLAQHWRHWTDAYTGSTSNYGT